MSAQHRAMTATLLSSRCMLIRHSLASNFLSSWCCCDLLLIQWRSYGARTTYKRETPKVHTASIHRVMHDVTCRYGSANDVRSHPPFGFFNHSTMWCRIVHLGAGVYAAMQQRVGNGKRHYSVSFHVSHVSTSCSTRAACVLTQSIRTIARLQS